MVGRMGHASYLTILSCFGFQNGMFVRCDEPERSTRNSAGPGGSGRHEHGRTDVVGCALRQSRGLSTAMEPDLPVRQELMAVPGVVDPMVVVVAEADEVIEVGLPAF